MDLNVVSLFDGMSCGRLALERAGLPVNIYYSSEVDRFAIQIADKNYPQDKWARLGDVRDIDPSIFPNIDLLIGGSPCQSFSFAGKQAGMSTKDSIEILTLDHYLGLKTMGFEFEGQSYLFWEYVRLLRALHPRYFLLENVVMTKKWERIISEALGVEPILINSALLSAQNRKRLYWTNIPGVNQPEDQGILLKNIIENGMVVDRDKSFCLDANYYKGTNLKQYKTKNRRQIVFYDYLNMDLIGKKLHHIGNATNIKGFDSTKRVYGIYGKSPTLSTCQGGHRKPKIGFDDLTWRELTPTECERLQTLPDNYTEKLESNFYALYINEEISDKGELLCNAKLMDVQEKQQLINMESSVSYTTKDIRGTEILNCLKKNITQIKNVSIVIEKLAKKVAEQEKCVIDITKIGSGTETRYIQTKLGLLMDQGDTKNELTVRIGTDRYLKIILEENLKDLRLYIMSILIKLIIELKIYTYVMDRANIHFYIDSLRESQGNLLSLELSGLKMESIKLCSNTQRYKMLGNGWTVDVVAHILKGIKCN